MKKTRTSPCRKLCVKLPWGVTRLPALLLAAFGSAAMAQPSSGGHPVAELPTVTVEGKTVPAGTASTFGMSFAPREIPQSISTVDRERMEEQGLSELEDVLNQATGLTVQPYTNLRTGYSVRGFDVDSFEIDGAPAGFGGQASAPQDMAAYERIEILRGANGLMHGTGNPAATVNLVRKMPTAQRQLNLQLSGGRWGRYRGEVDASGPLNEAGTLRGRGVVAYEDRGFFTNIAKRKTSLLYGVVQADLSQRTTLTLGGQYQDVDSKTDMGGVPMAADGGDLHLPRSNYMNTSWSRFAWETYQGFAALEHELDSGWRTRLSVDYDTTSSKLKYAGVYGMPGIDAATGDGAILYPGAYRFKTSHVNANLDAHGPFTLFGREHEALFGINHSRHKHRMMVGQLDTNIMQPVNVYAWDPYSVPEPGVADYTPGSDDATREQSLYAMGRFSLAEPLTLVIGTRLSQWKQTTLRNTSKPGSQWIPYAGLIWDFSPNWSSYASYSRVNKPQTELTYDGGILDPMEGNSYEIGVKGDLAGDQLHVSAALFRIEQKKRALQDPDHPGIGQATYYINGGKVRSQGVELEASGNVAPNWGISTGYTYTSTKYVRDAANQGRAFSTLTPRHLFKLWTSYRLPWQEQRWTVGGGLHVQSAFTRSSDAITLRQGAYATVNARVGYRISRQWDLALNVTNLFDRRYYSSFFGPAWSNRYGEPRSFLVSLRGSF